MLKAQDVSYTYRDYKKNLLSADEIRDVLGKLGVTPREVLRKRDANKLGLAGDETDEQLISLMSEHPGLLQRPIGVVGDKAAIGRPVENLLGLLEA